MRKHFYLIVEDEMHPEKEGGVSIFDTRRTPSQKNEETVHQMFNHETDERWTETAVSLGYCDFDDEDDYEERAVDVIHDKLAEIDESHLRNAGLDPAEVLG